MTRFERLENDDAFVYLVMTVLFSVAFVCVTIALNEHDIKSCNDHTMDRSIIDHFGLETNETY